MDDILVCASQKAYLDDTPRKTIQTIKEVGFETDRTRSQYTCPWTYLRLYIYEQITVPQQLSTWDDPKALQDLHPLYRSINWVCPLLGEVLVLLFNLLCSSKDLDSLHALTPKAQVSIATVQETLSLRQAHCFELHLPFQLAVLEQFPVFQHFSSSAQAKLKKPPMLIKNPETRQISGPFKLITWKRGYAFVSSPSGPKWIPGKNIKPYLGPGNAAPSDSNSL
ncbi:uncharacterized protein LOC111940712 [Cyanistes caeruleus]|uniref:uncharacterized protein LOC111940712 n=1 Tax=Cyanistes caeruleus TaxID=156563 RepID=UPI000CDB318E|nr:uncharacterized protein LOC111940712 [Cyanistes caeruleus]